ncbi:hypothetical protein DNK47_00750 [Mycoplasma wenyonii]|uniref:Uncharacterized protein n=1 Tax=Mycoplasma wenyonii TaxID=65123 RepID=A0A328PLT7_9MOLU|nr:hypothetical protein [Mycoplasma wenyonii]RAO95364.1 hypothetical protein DNK47_00750 [Mycoplasma wenyonii]
MNYIGQLFGRKSVIGYGCLVLLGSVATAGVAEVEITNQTFSKWIKQTIQGIQDGMSSSSSASAVQTVTADQVFHPFTVAGKAVAEAATTVWPYITMGVVALPTLFKSWETLWAQIKSLVSSLIKPQIYKELFKDLHLKIWKTLSFAVAGGDGRSKFFGLFGESNKKSTLSGLTFLFGSHLEKNKKFRAKPEVFPYILMRWFTEPTKVTEKFEKLTKKIEKFTEQLNKGAETSSSDSSDSNGAYVYELGIPTVRDYIDVESGWKETVFELMWATEVMTKIKTGVDVTGGSKTWISTLGYLFTT